MVDSREAMESEYICVELVRSSSTKKAVVIDPGTYENSDFGRKLTLGVNIDGKIKRYRPNKESVKNLQVLGSDTLNWVAKIIELRIEKRSGKEAVIAIPFV